MRSGSWILCKTLLVWGVASVAVAQSAIQWQPDLDTAKRVAGQTNRLVLVHFWADWCKPCRAMEQEVFNRAEVAAAVDSAFVPVKLNVDHFPSKVREYGISILPTDIVITPDGKPVEEMKGSVDATRYVARLREAARKHMVSPARSYAQGPTESLTAPGPAVQGYSQQQMPGPAASGQSQYSASNYPGYYGQQPQGETASARPRYANQIPGDLQTPAPGAYVPQQGVVDPNLSANPGYQLPTPGYQSPTVGYQPPPSGYQSPSAGYQPPSSYQGATPGYQPPAPGYENPYSPSQPTASYYQNSVPGYQAPPTTYSGSPRDQITPGMKVGQEPWAPPIASPAAVSAPPDASAYELPAGSPALAMDGFCPVTLAEQEVWAQGDVNFGARHQGRTYLFAGPEQQQRFLAAPDRYAPAMSGCDVVMTVEQGQMVPGRRQHGVWHAGQVFLFSSEASLARFSANPQHYIAQLDRAAGASSNLARRQLSPPPAQNYSPQGYPPQYGGRY